VIILENKAFSVEWEGSCPGAVGFLLLSVQAFFRLSVELKLVLDGNYWTSSFLTLESYYIHLSVSISFYPIVLHYKYSISLSPSQHP